MSDGGGAAPRRSYDPTARDHRRTHGVVTDPELYADLDQREAVGIQASRLFTNGVRQRRHPGFEPSASRNVVYGAAMHVEPGGELANRHSVGVGSEQFCSIRGTQTGLSLSRIFAHRATLIGDPRARRAAPTTP